MRGRKAKVDEVRVVVGYCRVSTREQAVDGGSLPAQENRLRALAEADGRPIERVFVDAGYSAGSLKRPAIQELLALVREGKVAAIYCSKLDRMVRSLADLLAIVKLLQKHDVALVSASEHIDTGTAAGRMMVSMLGVIGEFERERLSERIKDVTFDKRQRKQVYCGSAPFGYRREGKKPRRKRRRAGRTLDNEVDAPRGRELSANRAMADRQRLQTQRLCVVRG